jgi:hypothetical protein
MPNKKRGRKPASMKKYGAATKRKMTTVMREWKKGNLKSGRGGRKVTNRKQAIAIGLSEARKHGAKVPPRRRASQP